jgi:hypothetical protein
VTHADVKKPVQASRPARGGVTFVPTGHDKSRPPKPARPEKPAKPEAAPKPETLPKD